MTTQTAKQSGVTAFNEGRKSAPALNQAFLVSACKSDTDTNKLMDAYIHGWTVAHLADTATIPTMPSVKTLKQITA